MDTMSAQQSKRTRRGVRRVKMPIKVLYKLDSNSEATMVAQIEQRIPVDVLPIRKKGQGKEGSANSTPLFARITLKTCIQSICMASPELLANTTKDYVLYAVDPVEAYRASLRHEPSTSSHSSSSQEASPSHSRKSRSSAAFMVGKGYLSHALSQEGSGVSTVHGRVRGEFDDDDEEDEGLGEDDEDDEEFWESRILEVFLELKESNSTESAPTMEFLGGGEKISSRQDLGSTSTYPVQKREASLSQGPLKEIVGSISNTGLSRTSNYNELPSKSGSQKQLLHLLQALQAHTQQDSKSLTRLRSSIEGSDASTPGRMDLGSGMASSPAGKSDFKRNRARFSSPGKASSSASSVHPNGAQSSPVKAVTKTLGSSSTNRMKSNLLKSKKRSSAPLQTDGESPILGGVTPGYEADYLSGPSPSYNVGESSKTASSKPILKRNVCSASNDEQCYNCGIRGEVYWRYLELKDDSEATFYDSSICFFNGKKSFRSCNACGIYFLRYKGVSRPEFVWREHEAKRKEKMKRVLSQGNSSTTSEDDDEMNGKKNANGKAKRKGTKFSRTLSEVCAIDSKRLAHTSKGPNDDDGAAMSKGKKKAKFEVKEEKSDSNEEQRNKRRKLNEEEKEEVRRNPGQERKFVEDFEKARLRDLVMDQDGNWRSKRSILENPTNRRVGRPPGRKTGAGLGRQRNQKAALKAAAAAAADERKKAKDEMIDVDHTSQTEEICDIMKASTETDKGKETIDLVGNQAVADALQAILSSSSPIRPAPLNDRSGMTQIPHSSFAVPFAPNHGMMQHHMPHSTPGQPYNHQHHKTPLSVSRVRYGAPAHLMMSSPATAFQTVMDEADTDWKALFGFGGDGLGPTRRSPRKKPAGVHGEINPYATNFVSPSRQSVQKFIEPDANAAGINGDMLMQMTSSSPLTRSRVKSGQFEWAFSSSDDVGGQKKKKVSSALTSPTSPSPTRTRTNLTSDRKKRSSQIMLEAGPIGSNRNGKQTNKNKQRDFDSLDDGPFVGLSSIDGQGLLEDDEDRCEDDDGPGSPTLGRSRRLDEKKRNADNKTDLFSSAPVDLNPSGDLSLQSDWQRNPSMRDLFPSPSPSKGWDAPANGSPSQAALWNSPSSWALRMPTPSPVKAIPEPTTTIDKAISNGKNTPVDLTNLPVVQTSTDVSEKKKQENEAQKPEPGTLAPPVQRRKPLPATVEDASPSEASNPSPNDEDDEDDEDDGDLDANGEMVIDMTDGENLAALMQMFEDPYGLLTAAGINFSSVPTENSTGQQQQSQSDKDGNHLAQIELFKKFDFGKELGSFNQAGANGIAANAGPSASSISTSSAFGAVAKPTASMMVSPSKIKINRNLLKTSPGKIVEENKDKSSNVNSIQNISTNTDVNFGDWIWSDVQGTPTKQSAK